MEICWDNLSGLRLNNAKVFVKGNNSFIERESCAVCGNPYLTNMHKQSIYCGRGCALKNREFSDETKIKMSDAWKNRPAISNETKKKMSNSRKCRKNNIKHSKETKDKLSEIAKNRFSNKENIFMYGKHHSEKTKKAISIANSGTNSYWYGKKHKKSTLEKMAASAKKGCDNILWKGGVTKKNLPLYDTYYNQLNWAEDVRLNININNIRVLEVKCKKCNEWFVPTIGSVRDRIYALNNVNNNIYRENNFYCSEGCKKTCNVYGKHSDANLYVVKNNIFTAEELSMWSQEVLKRADYICEYCDIPAKHAHHILPKKLEPFYALDPDNGIACCTECHYKYGHKDECSTGKLAHIKCDEIKEEKV